MTAKKDKVAAAEAWSKSRAPGADALLWLMRARRLAPEDPRIALELAQNYLARGRLAEAQQEFAAVADRYDVATAWLGQVLAFGRAGQHEPAAAALEKLLTRHCLPDGDGPDEEGFCGFALHIATQAGYGGFTGRRANGAVIRQGQGRRMLGAKPDLAALARVEGLVAWEKEGLTGWAARPAWPEAPPDLWLRDARGAARKIKFGKTLPPDDSAPLLPRYRFRLSARFLAGLTPPFTLAGAEGPQIFGSPVDPAALQAAPVPAAQRGTPPAMLPKRAKLALLMPVYRGLAETKAALASVLAALPAGAQLIVVDDATPEPALAQHLDKLAAAGCIRLLRNGRNLGFCAAVNRGLAAAKGRDVLLLNADILLPPGAIETLAAVAYADAATGTVTPFSNEGSICSYPAAAGGNAMPDLPGTTRLQKLARAANGLAAVDIPTAVGFCMFIRHDCLATIGGFRGEIFAQGYGEENDFCLRARHFGYRHMAAPGAFVAHAGGVSFRAATHGLMARNLASLNRLFPGYPELVQAHKQQDKLRPHRAALDEARLRAGDEARLRAGVRQKGAVLMISHAHGGGVARQVAADMAACAAQGLQPLLLTTQFPENPKKTRYPWPALLCAGEPADYPGLVFTLPGDMQLLTTLLTALKVQRVVLHHMLGQHESLRGLAAALGVPQTLVVHDYASFCPRVNLLNRPDKNARLRYCGEPALAGCMACCARKDGQIFDATPLPALRARATAEFAAADQVIVPSRDAARRLKRHFPRLEPQITPWEDDAVLPALRPPTRREKLRVAVLGGIGPAKGYDVLLDCAADAAARNLAMEFMVIGGSADDDRLLQAGIYVTGFYREGEAQALMTALQPDIAFLPSIWPETWCFALSEAWRAGLAAVVFDLGAQGERMRAVKRGVALPLGLPAGRINDMIAATALRAGF